ncbi:MAG: outer membrane lipoprotein carrier protein LolA [Hyphomicrobiales bacterium]|nr:outer membrane lipoprotein carrier protein LolA [Hyphomicrobiales bacterium]|tara:strand:+ start:16 stop:639 length:624 start_codon:yes stop_codon:yes gene_type:complete
MFRKLLLLFILFFYNSTSSQASFLDPLQLEAVNSVSQYLNNIEHMEGDFIQINPNNSVSDGRFYIRKPGRFRFDYTKPESLLVVSDGVWLGIIDRDLDTLDRYPIRSAPHYVIFKDNVNLMEDARILGIEFYDKFLILSIEGLTDEEIGEITLHFHIRDEINESYTNLELYEWYTIDAQGFETNVKLSNVKHGIIAENSFFVVKKDK